MPVYEYGKLFEPANGLRLVEREAQRCLRYCRHRLGLDDVPVPIPVEDWIESALGIRFGVADLSHLGPNVLGATYIRDREILVSETVLSNEGRFRFTCAHELGHFRLHAKLRQAFREDAEPGSHDTDRIERQADRFAAAFLMPVPAFEREVVSICAAFDPKPGLVLSELMMPTAQSDALWKDFVLPALCRRFRVSQTAAAIRCYGLRLSGKDPRSLMPMRFFYEFLPTPAAAPRRRIERQS